MTKMNANDEKEINKTEEDFSGVTDGMIIRAKLRIIGASTLKFALLIILVLLINNLTYGYLTHNLKIVSEVALITSVIGVCVYALNTETKIDTMGVLLLFGILCLSMRWDSGIRFNYYGRIMIVIGAAYICLFACFKVSYFFFKDIWDMVSDKKKENNRKGLLGTVVLLMPDVKKLATNKRY